MDNSLLRRLALELPVVQAPMAGGLTTPELVAAVSNAGALGSFGAGYLTPEAIGTAVAAARRLTDRGFALNLFVNRPETASAAQIDRANALLAPYRRELGLDPGLASGGPQPTPPPDLDAQIAAVLAARPAVFSFTFGIPTPEVLAACRAAGIITIGTATTLAEGLALEAAGVDAVMAQGAEAGGHRGSFLAPPADSLVGTLPLVSLLVARLRLPVIAAGGIMTGAAAAAMLRAGAQAVCLGTAFLACDEAGTNAAYRAALQRSEAAETALTRAFSGRLARGLANRFLREMAAHEAELPGYPVMNALTRDIRTAAAEQGRPEFLSLWAGQAAPLIRARPAAELLRALAAEMGAGRAAAN